MGSLKRKLCRELLLKELELKLAVVRYLVALLATYDTDTSQDKINEGFSDFLDEIEKIFEETQGTKVSKGESRSADEFLENLRGVVADLLRKSHQVSSYREIRAKIDASNPLLFMPEMGRAIVAEHIQKTEFTPFEVSFILEPGYYRATDTHKEETVGLHFTGTPFSLISGMGKERSEECVRGTLRHEQKHNLLDGASSIQRKGASFEEIKKGVTAGSVEHMRAKEFLDGLRGEIVAASEQAERTWISGSRDDFDALRTAGREASKMIVFLAEERFKAEGMQDGEKWREELLRVENEIRDRFRGIAGHMKESLGVARELGGRATEDVHILFILLRPSQYRHILSYLECRYGEEKVREILEKMQVAK
jgi:hypothetical protein